MEYISLSYLAQNIGKSYRPCGISKLRLNSVKLIHITFFYGTDHESQKFLIIIHQISALT